VYTVENQSRGDNTLNSLKGVESLQTIQDLKGIDSLQTWESMQKERQN